MSETLPTTWLSGHEPTGSEYSNMLSVVQAVYRQPICRVSLQGALSLTTATVTAVTFDHEYIDNYNWFSASSTNITVDRAGEYLLVAAAEFASNATSFRQLRLNQNASNVDIESVTGTSGDDTRISATWQRTATAGTVFSLSLYQNSGGPLAMNTLADGTDRVRFSVIWLGSGLSTGP